MRQPLRPWPHLSRGPFLIAPHPTESPIGNAAQSFHRRRPLSLNARIWREQVIGIIQWFGVPIVAAAISAVYFATARKMSLSRRISVSAHGVLLLMIYVVAIGVHSTEGSHPNLVWPFLAAFVAPALSIGFAFAWYPGSKALHLLIAPLLYCGLWIAFIGGMAVTGLWL
jgi:hypothetical protein